MIYENGTNGTAVTDVVVVGGGLAGLTTAVLLARAGRSVIVLEKGREVGGRARTQSRGEFLFNLGPHALYVSGQAAQLLHELGVPTPGRMPKFGRTAVAVYNDQIFILPLDPVTIWATKLLSPGEKLGLGRLLAAAMARPEAVAHQTWREWVNSRTKSERLRQLTLALGQLATYANAADSLSAAIPLTQMQLAFRGNVRYVDGGWQTLVDGLRRAAEVAGIRIVTGDRVTAVHDHIVHLADGSAITAGAIILTIDPAMASQLVPGHAQLRDWSNTAVPVQAAIFDVALRRLPRPDRLFALGMDRPLYFSVHSRFARLGPPEGVLIHLAKYLPVGEASDAQADEQELELFLDLLQPGWRDELLEQRFLPQMTVVNRLVTALDGGLNGRPPVQLPGSDHIYLVGDWIGPTGWLADGALASAQQAAKLILAGLARQPIGRSSRQPIGQQAEILTS